MHASTLLLACWLAVSAAPPASSADPNERPSEFTDDSPLRPIPADQVRLEPIAPDRAPADSPPAGAASSNGSVPEIITHLAEPIVVRPQSSQWKTAPATAMPSSSIPASAAHVTSPAANTQTQHDSTAATTPRPANRQPASLRNAPPANPIRGGASASKTVGAATFDGKAPPSGVVATSGSRESMPAAPVRPAVHETPDVGQPLREESLTPAQRVAGLPPPRELGTLIRPVNFQQTDATGGAVSRGTASLLMQTASIPPDDPEWALAGQATPLSSVIERAADSSQRLAIIRAYWRAHSDVCSYNWAVEEGAFIAGVSPTPQPSDQSLLMAARLESQAHLQRTRLAATASQVDLAEVARFTARALPLPADSPLVTAYQTKFDKIFANRTPPAGLRRIAVSIPLQKQLIDTSAEAVASATDAVRELNDEFQQGQTSLVSLLDAHRRLRKQRLDFLDSVRTYNEQVASYAVALGGSVNTQTLVSMLIPVSAVSRTAQATRMDPAAASRDFRDPRDTTARGFANPPVTNGGVRGIGGFDGTSSGIAPAGTSMPMSPSGPMTPGSPAGMNAPSGSSRPGNWMSPRTSARDGMGPGAANVAPSLNSAPPNWSGSVRREPASANRQTAANRPATTFQSPAAPAPTFDADQPARFAPSPAAPANAAAPVMAAIPTVRANAGSGGFQPPAGGFVPPDGGFVPPDNFAAQPSVPSAPIAAAPPSFPAAFGAPPANGPPASDIPPANEPPPANDPPNALPAEPEARVAIPQDADAPAGQPAAPARQPGAPFEAPGGDFVPPPDGFVPPESGSQLGTPQ